MREFKSRWAGLLVSALVGYFDKSSADLPDYLRSRVELIFSLPFWDASTPNQRRRRALDWNAQCESADQQDHTEEIELGYDIADGKTALSSLPFIKRMEAKDKLAQLHADFQRVSARRDARAAAFRSAGNEAKSTPAALDLELRRDLADLDARPPQLPATMPTAPQQSVALAKDDAPAGKSRPLKPGAGNTAYVDDELAARVLALVDGVNFKSPRAAARSIMDDIPGHGHPENRARRLADKARKLAAQKATR